MSELERTEQKTRFEEAVDWVEKVSAFAFKSGTLSLPVHEPDHALLQLRLGIYWQAVSKADGVWRYSERAIEQLVALTETSNGARTLANDIASWHLGRSQKMPKALEVYCSLAIVGQLKKLPKSRRKEAWVRNQLLLVLTNRTHMEFGLVLTRGDTTDVRQSVCDAVAMGLERNGYHISPGAIRSLLTSKKPNDIALRNEFNEWISLAKRAADEHPNIVSGWKLSHDVEN